MRLTNGYWQAWIADPEGKTHRQITADPIDKIRLSWSSDRKELLCNRNDGVLVKVNLSNGKQTKLNLPLKGMLDAQLSPNGQWAAFSKQSTTKGDNNDLWIIKIDGSGQRKLTNKPFLQQLPAWSIDGKTLAYASGTGKDTHDIWHVDIKSGGQTQLTVGKHYDFDSSYSPSGEIAFTSNKAGNYDIWVLPKDGKKPQQLTRASSKTNNA